MRRKITPVDQSGGLPNARSLWPHRIRCVDHEREKEGDVVSVGGCDVSVLSTKEAQTRLFDLLFRVTKLEQRCSHCCKTAFRQEGVGQQLDGASKGLAQVHWPRIPVLTVRLEIETLHDSWLAVLKDELTKPYFLKVRTPARSKITNRQS